MEDTDRKIIRKVQGKPPIPTFSPNKSKKSEQNLIKNKWANAAKTIRLPLNTNITTINKKEVQTSKKSKE